MSLRCHHIECQCCGHIFDSNDETFTNEQGYLECPECYSYLNEDGSPDEDN